MGSRILPWLAMTMVLVGLSNGDFKKDKEDCESNRYVLDICLPYVRGQIKAPSPECCGKLKRVLAEKRVCLCILVKDRDKHSLYLKIDATLALGLPKTCHLFANITECPKLMHLSPNSPEAKVFEDYVKNANKSKNTTVTPSGGSLKNDVMRGKIWGTLYLIIIMLIVI